MQLNESQFANMMGSCVRSPEQKLLTSGAGLRDRQKQINSGRRLSRSGSQYFEEMPSLESGSLSGRKASLGQKQTNPVRIWEDESGHVL